MNTELENKTNADGGKSGSNLLLDYLFIANKYLNFVTALTCFLFALTFFFLGAQVIIYGPWVLAGVGFFGWAIEENHEMLAIDIDKFIRRKRSD